MLPRPTRLENSVWQYIDGRLSQPHPQFGGLPICPYVQRYRDTIIVRECDAPARREIKRGLAMMKPRISAVVLAWREWRDPKLRRGADTFERMCDKWQARVFDSDITILLDHPDNPHPVANAWTGFGEGVLVILQRTSLLERHRAQLQKTDYYRNFSKQELSDL